MIGKRSLETNPTVLDIQNVHSQLNYSNQILHQIALKIYEDPKETISKSPLGIKPLERSLITPTRFTDKEYKEFKLGNNTDNLLLEINKKLENLNIKNINILDIPEEEIGDIDLKEIEDSIFKIQRKFNNNPDTNNRPTTRNYYRRPTIPDIQFEEWNLESPSAFNGEGIQEWNIDGMTEHQILRKTHEMTMAATAYRAKHSEQQTVKLLIAGFTGSLKGWWDNYLTSEQKNYIINVVKAEDQTPLMVETLILSIIQSFMGDSNVFDTRTNILLHNLRCPTLGDFRWYVDNFIIMVMTREDCKENFWKEKFIAGLPPVFATKVREKLGIVCFKCGRYGHMKKDCRVKEKINNLDMSEQLKDQIAKLLLYESDNEESSNEEENYIENIETSSDEDSECECDENPCSCSFNINVISASEKLMLEMVDKLPNEDEKLDYLIKLKNLILQDNHTEETSTPEFSGYDFSKILKQASIKEKPINLQDLQREVKELKEEVKLIKNQLTKVESETSLQNELLKGILEKEERPSSSNNDNTVIKVPNAFWDRNSFEIELPYEEEFTEKDIPTKAKPVQLNKETLEYCRKEIKQFLDKKLIRPSKSPWSCAAFYVQNASEIERGEPRMVINYKPLNKVLKWIRYPLPNKSELISRIYNATIFSKFDMKSGYYQIKVKETDKLRKNPKPWTPELTKIVQEVKAQVKTLPCLGIPHPEAQLIVETDASDQGYGGILKQKIDTHPDQIVRYHSGIWNPAQSKYSTIKKEILSIVLWPSSLSLDDFSPSYSHQTRKLPNTLKNPLENKFTVLAQTPKTPEKATSSNTKNIPKEFHILDHCEHVVTIEDHWNEEDPWKILQSLAPPKWSWIPKNENLKKNKKFYQFILIDTGSAEITPVSDTRNPSIINYSKLKIIKVLSYLDWKTHPFTEKTFSRPFDPPSYSYFDYQKAWSYILLECNPKHSWYISFKNELPGPIPNWFIDWFINIHPVQSIIPENVLTIYRKFKTLTPNESPHLRLIKFCSAMGISWLLAHILEVHQHKEESYPKTICRKTKVFWWKKFEVKYVEERFQKWKISGLQTSRPKAQPQLKIGESLTVENLEKLPSSKEEKSLLKKKLLEALSSLGSDSEEEEEVEDCYAIQMAQNPEEDEELDFLNL
uniref:Polyprotein n=1 Tax=Cajanus cajan TaxID=3821 RepID=A0A151U814_CAJCA|nr:polyprotein [Cajanus cajan]